MNDPGRRTLVLHALRLGGLADVDEVVDVSGLDSAAVTEELRRLQAEELVSTVRGDTNRWALTSAGRDDGEALLAQELANSDPGTRQVVTKSYLEFLDLNQSMLATCTQWQIISQDPVELNDHSDPAYDASVIAQLTTIDSQIQPVCRRLECSLGRFTRYGPGFAEALKRVGQGATEWFTRPTILSYHTLWFQLHEDLLATLGLERAAETARLNGSRPTDSPEASPGSNWNRAPT